MLDLLILGGGPAGYHAAEEAGKAGLSVVLVEKSELGGVCLNEGCVPSKTLLYSAKLLGIAKESQKYGVTAENVQFNLATVMARKQKVIETLRKGIEFTLKRCNVTIERGQGKIVGSTNGIFSVSVNDKTLEAKRLLICTGSSAIRPPIPGADQNFVYTNREILSVSSQPKSLAVIGGGVIGLELATFFAETGTDVTVIELLPTIGGPIDTEIASALHKELEKKGIKFHLQSKVTAIGDKSVTFERDGNLQTVSADIVLLSVGRRPVTQGLGLETINVFVERGAIKTNDQGRTNIPGVWAAGDVNGQSMLAHTAYREADVCIDDILGKKATMRYNSIPGVIYTHPEVATVGLTAAEAQKKGIAVITGKLPLSYNGRYLAETEGGRGFCTVVVDKEYRTLLGVHIIGHSCSEMIYGAAAMIEDEMRVDEIREIVFPHPTVSEIIKDTILHCN